MGKKNKTKKNGEIPTKQEARKKKKDCMKKMTAT